MLIGAQVVVRGPIRWLLYTDSMQTNSIRDGYQYILRMDNIQLNNIHSQSKWQNYLIDIGKHSQPANRPYSNMYWGMFSRQHGKSIICPFKSVKWQRWFVTPFYLSFNAQNDCAVTIHLSNLVIDHSLKPTVMTSWWAQRIIKLLRNITPLYVANTNNS